jgi:hypothetical protein
MVIEDCCVLFAQVDPLRSEKWSEQNATGKDDSSCSITGKVIHCWK